MDYEKKYKEVLERARQFSEKPYLEDSKGIVEYIFPELAESEDEMIRKKVIDVLKLNVRGAESQMQASRGVDRTFEVYACNKVIAWLEKQGKNNMGISEATKQELEDNLNKALEKETPESWNKFLEKQGEQNPAWSEKDERILSNINIYIRKARKFPHFSKENIEEADNWLKSLKERFNK